jgi:hypothetical protein
MVIGDWNEILYSHEKEGGTARPIQYMQAFRDALTDCGLEDIGYIGDIFTWRRNELEGGRESERGWTEDAVMKSGLHCFRTPVF